MNCHEWEDVIVDIARGRPVEPGQRAAMAAHVAGCEACGARLASERVVTERLATLRASMREVAAPAEVEAALVTAFRAQTGARSPSTVRVTAPRWALAAAAVLALVVGGLVAVSRLARDPGQPPTALVPPDPVAAAPLATVPIASAGTVNSENETPAGAAPSRLATPRRRRAARAPADQPGFAYVAVPGSPPRWSDAPLLAVRVELSYASLPAMGIPITRENAGATLPVEVLVGEDGIARGIRLVDPEHAVEKEESR